MLVDPVEKGGQDNRVLSQAQNEHGFSLPGKGNARGSRCSDLFPTAVTGERYAQHSAARFRTVPLRIRGETCFDTTGNAAE